MELQTANGGWHMVLGSVYKDHLLAARCRLDQLRSQGRGGTAIPREIARIYARREGRIWSGICGMAVFLSILVDLVCGGRRAGSLLLATWPAMAIAFFVAYLLARLHLRRLNKRQAAPSSPGDELTDLARIEGGWATRLALAGAQRAMVKSLALPLAALCLATPLTLHLLYGAIARIVDNGQSFSLSCGASCLRDFAAWIRVSLIIVGHAHLVLAGLAVRHAVLVGRELAAGAPRRGLGRGFTALLWTTAASLIPGIFLLFIPSLIVLFTGLAFVPWIFAWAARRAAKETAILASFTPGQRRPESSEPRRPVSAPERRPVCRTEPGEVIGIEKGAKRGGRLLLGKQPTSDKACDFKDEPGDGRQTGQRSSHHWC